MEIAKMTREF